LASLRKDNPILVYGVYTLLDKRNPNVFAYTRKMDNKRILVLLNFTSKPAIQNTGINLNDAKLLLSNYPGSIHASTLRPYEAAIYELP
jgi:oligo-1,6-glucosidase